ncbi:MAG: nitrite/sulfite reductase, partial [Acidobacteriota bacterium]
FRLGHGIYGQRQPDVQMVRVKIPAGRLQWRQIEALARIASRFGSGIAHLTTRQDIQFHHVHLRDVTEVMKHLAAVGLTTREACGNSVRNVTACPVAGFIRDELFDVTPYATAISAFLLRHPLAQQLARKFKVALSACPEDCVAAAIHDVGLLGRVDEAAGVRRIGFHLLAGGGLGSTPFVAQSLFPFVPVQDLLLTLKAILKVTADHGNRRNRGWARLKFLVQKIGRDRFRRLVESALKNLTAAERQEADLARYLTADLREVVSRHLQGHLDLVSGGQGPEAEPSALWRDSAEAGESGTATALEPLQQEEGLNAPGGSAFRRWKLKSVRPHHRPDRAVVQVAVPLGDLTVEQLLQLSSLAREQASPEVRLTVDQNLVFPDVALEALEEIHTGLANVSLAEASIGTALNVTSCPGTETCNLGITASKGLARALRTVLAETGKTTDGVLPEELSIKISGCPNGCGQHHLGHLGFHGVVLKQAERQLPAYQLHLGGKVSGETTRLGRNSVKIPARRIPDAVKALLAAFEAEGGASASFTEFAAGLAPVRIQAILAPYMATESSEENSHLDWGETTAFTTAGMGTGECAGAGMDLADGPLDPYMSEIAQAERFMAREQWADALANLNRSQYTLARVLLAEIGKDPESDHQCASEMRAELIDRGHAGETWNRFHDSVGELLRTRRPDPGVLQNVAEMARHMAEEARRTLDHLRRLKAAGQSHRIVR